VHGGFGGKTVSRDAHVLEVQASKHTRHAHSRHASVAEEPQLNVHKSPDRRGGEESVAQHSQEEVAATKASRSPVASASILCHTAFLPQLPSCDASSRLL
jgi:hypothetical protein